MDIWGWGGGGGSLAFPTLNLEGGFVDVGVGGNGFSLLGTFRVGGMVFPTAAGWGAWFSLMWFFVLGEWFSPLWTFVYPLRTGRGWFCVLQIPIGSCNG